jgi:hypothetical protein
MKYQEVMPKADIKKLADIALEAASLFAGVPAPLLRFFVESPDGTIERPRPVLGFCTFLYDKPAIFVKADQSPQSLVETIFHETHHSRILLRDLPITSREETEREARAFENWAPTGRSIDELHAALIKNLLKYSLEENQVDAARQYHSKLQALDPEAAKEFAWDILTPRERRLKQKLKADKERRDVERQVVLEEKLTALNRWFAEEKRKLAW